MCAGISHHGSPSEVLAPGMPAALALWLPVMPWCSSWSVSVELKGLFLTRLSQKQDFFALGFSSACMEIACLGEQ